jgi:starch synthase
MDIIHIASEMAPFAKVGGLGDVIHGLSKELSRLGHQVQVILPKYDCIESESLSDLKIMRSDLCTTEGGSRYSNTIWSAKTDGLDLILIEPHHPSYYFNRGRIYGSQDDTDRFAYFSKAALDYLLAAHRQCDSLHLHDWPTALIAPLYREIYYPAGLRAKRVVLTLHNLEHQGRSSPKILDQVGLPTKKLFTADQMQDPNYPELINFLKGAIVAADAVTTVSPNYEKEIKTPEGGFGLHTLLIKYQHKLKGILNGIDPDYWDPEKDRHLIAHYPSHPPFDEKKWESLLRGKKTNRAHLSKQLGIRVTKTPLVVSVARLVFQKAPQLIKQGIIRTLERGGQFILLGSEPDPEIGAEFLEMKRELLTNHNVAICFDKNETLAHLIFAAADLFFIPSLFEPCGLTQLIALRYGTVPIARMTGGLVDTVFDIETSPQRERLGNGFTFEFPDIQGVNWVIDRALLCWEKNPKRWQTLMQHGMQMDFSWRHSAQEYLNIYTKGVSDESKIG